VTASSDPRQDIEKFVAMGGGSFDLLLNMVDRAQPPKTSLMETASQTLERPTWLPVNYRLEHGPDVLSLRRADGLFVAAFSAQDATGKAVMRVVEEDRRGLPAYFRQKEYAGSARRLVETRAKHSWERFLRTERRMLDARRNGQMAKVLAWRLPDESQEALNRMTSEDRMDCLRAELARMEWLLEPQGRRNSISRSASLRAASAP
jgi:hypothetical protein